MKKLTYSLHFTGSAAPKDGSPTVLAVAASAAGGSLRTEVGAGGVAGTLEPGNAQAAFESTVTMTSEATFDEQGSISFGDGHKLRFSTVGQGHVVPSPEDGVTAGSVIWKVDGGGGQFKGASGYITSNFYFNVAGEVTDNQLHVIFVE